MQILSKTFASTTLLFALGSIQPKVYEDNACNRWHARGKSVASSLLDVDTLDAPERNILEIASACWRLCKRGRGEFLDR